MRRAAGSSARYATDIPSTYVPARNTIFLSVALGWAEVLDASDLFIGVNAIDYSGYPDCRPEFIHAFESMARLATKAGVEGRPLRVHTPLIALTKADIVRLGTDAGSRLRPDPSCYDPAPDGTALRAVRQLPAARCRVLPAAGFSDPARRAHARLTWRSLFDSRCWGSRPCSRSWWSARSSTPPASPTRSSCSTCAARPSPCPPPSWRTSNATSRLPTTWQRSRSRHPEVRQLRPETARRRPAAARAADQSSAMPCSPTRPGKIIAWAAPPLPEVEGRLAGDWLAGVAKSGERSQHSRPRRAGARGPRRRPGFPIRRRQREVLGVLATLGAPRDARGGVLEDPAARRSVITVTDEHSVVVARSLDSSRYVGPTSRRRHARAGARGRAVHGPPGRASTVSSASSATSVVARGPWLVSVGIPTAVARARTGAIDRRNSRSCSARSLFVLLLSLLVTERAHQALNDLGRTAKRVARGDLSPLEPSDQASAELAQLHRARRDDHEPPGGPGRGGGPGRRGASRPRGEGVAAAAADQAGTAGGDWRARVRRRARAEQPAAGDSGLRRAAAAPGRSA